MTIPMVHGFMTDTWDTCMIDTTREVVLATIIPSQRLTESNVSELRPGYLFYVRQRRCERWSH